VRGLRLLGASALVAVLLGALAGHALFGAVLGDAGVATRTRPERSDPPTRLGSGSRSSLRVDITPADPTVASLAVPDGGHLDLRVTVVNPYATAVSGLAVQAQVDRGGCTWLDGPFPAPFGLAPAATTTRTCRLALDGRTTATLRVTVLQHTSQVAASTVEVPWVPAPGDQAGAIPAGPDPADPPPPPEPPPPGPGPAPGLQPGPCPHLVTAAVVFGSPLLDQLGPGLTERARSLDLVACPRWAAVGGLAAVRQDTGDACPPWLVSLDGGPPSARLTGAQADGCPAAPLEIEVLGQPTEVAAMIAALVAWAVDGDPTRAPTFHDAARLGTGTVCDGRSVVALRNPYEQSTSDGTRIYRTGLIAC
jgi:hypothetical protein